jgi:RimJ/RimL family protein N-acetyltransferase
MARSSPSFAAVAKESARGTVTLSDGSVVSIDRLTPADAPLLAAAFERLSTESRQLRFLTPKPTLTDSELRYLTEVDGHHHEALGAIDPSTGQGIAVARFVRDPKDPSRAEVAITAADDWQRRGLGKVLLTRLAERARAEGIARFTALVSSENRNMQILLERLDAPTRITRIGSNVADYEIELAPKGLGSQLETALRAAGAGHFPVPPRVRELLTSLVPIKLDRR